MSSELEKRRAAELEWARNVMPSSLAEFQTQSAILFRDMFGDDFAGVVAGKNDAGEPVALYIEGKDGGETVEVRELGADLGGVLAQQALDTGEPPPIPTEVLEAPPLRRPIKALDSQRKS